MPLELCELRRPPTNKIRSHMFTRQQRNKVHKAPITFLRCCRCLAKLFRGDSIDALADLDAHRASGVEVLRWQPDLLSENCRLPPALDTTRQEHGGGRRCCARAGGGGRVCRAAPPALAGVIAFSGAHASCSRRRDSTAV